MVKKFLFSTVLTTVISMSAIAMADEVKSSPQPQPEAAKIVQNAAPAKVVKKVKHHAKAKKHHDDAYKPNAKSHVVHAAKKEQAEEVLMFAEVNKHTPEQTKRDTLTNNDGIAIKVGGKVDIQYGFVDQNDAFRNPLNNSQLPAQANGSAMPAYGKEFTNQSAIVSNGELNFSATRDDFNGNKYGLEITADANTSPAQNGNPNFASKVFIFAENNVGRFEVGANNGVSENMALTAATIAKATGGIDGDASNWVPYTVINQNDNLKLQDLFLSSPALPYASQYSKKANKITYYSPVYNGLQVGLSFVPDVKVQGTLYDALSFKGCGYKNVIEGGISYENKFNDALSMKLAATGQVGESRDAYESPTKSYELERLAAWEVGGKLSYNTMSVVASYGDWGKSGAVKNPAAGTPSKKANFWTAGVAYDHQDKAGISLTYMNSERRGPFAMGAIGYINANQADVDKAINKFDSISLGAEYNLMPGLKPYAEFTTFNYKTDLSNVLVNKGNVMLAGIKLNF